MLEVGRCSHFLQVRLRAIKVNFIDEILIRVNIFLPMVVYYNYLHLEKEVNGTKNLNLATV